MLAYAKGSSVAFGFATSDVIDPAATNNNHVTDSANRRLKASKTQDDENRTECSWFLEHLAARLKEFISSFHSTQPWTSLFEALETESQAWDHQVIKGKMEEAKALTPVEQEAYYKQLEGLEKKLNFPNVVSHPLDDKLLSSLFATDNQGLLAHIAANRVMYGSDVKYAEGILNLLYKRWLSEEKSPDAVLQLLQKRGDYSFPIDYEQLTVLNGYIKHFNAKKHTDETLVKTILKNFGDAKSSRIFMRNTKTMLGSQLPEESLAALMHDWNERNLDLTIATTILRPNEKSEHLDDLGKAIWKAYSKQLDGKKMEN
uniref:RxLR effector candidate protein n=1 Tax=Hyaloperonospora arabidopsidis (strain Emoy2) TaxID=559515 RepID=M4BY89_HYAAE